MFALLNATKMDEPPPEELAAITAELQLLDARLADPEKAISLIESAKPMEALAARTAADARAAAIVSDRPPTVEAAAAATAPGVARQASTPHQSDDDADDHGHRPVRRLRRPRQDLRVGR